MNTSRKGNAYEWECKRRAEANGWTVLRMAASHGPFDLVLLAPGRIAFFQLKSGRFSCAAAEKLRQDLEDRYPGIRADIGVVHECRTGCKTKGHVPQPRCLHVNEAGL